ncbi:MAG: hypothetical protein RIF46_00305 [Cyclobacteriaceae bacterium]
MKKYLFRLCLLIVSVTSYAQEASTLPQYLAMNPLIQRDPDFVNMYANLETRINATGTGLDIPDLNAFYMELKDFRKNLSLLRFSVAKTGDNFQVLKSKSFKDPEGIDTITVASKALTDSLVYFLTGSFEVAQALPSTKLAQKQRRSLLLYYIMVAAVTQESFGIEDFNGKTLENLSLELSEKLRPIIDVIANSDNVSNLDKQLQLFLDNLKARAVEFSEILESKFRQVEEGIDRSFVTANTGFGMSREEGSLGGGLYITIWSDPGKDGTRNFEAGVFIAGLGEIGQNAETADSLVSQPFMAGASLKFRFKSDVQLSLLGAYKQNTEEINNQRNFFEFGGGITTRVRGGIILGGSVFYQNIDKKIVEGAVTDKINSIWTAGFTIQKDVPGSPIILLGATSQGNTIVPNFQVSYPINFGNGQ